MANNLLCVGHVFGWQNNSMSGRVYLSCGLSPALAGISKVSGYAMPYIGVTYETE